METRLNYAKTLKWPDCSNMLHICGVLKSTTRNILSFVLLPKAAQASPGPYGPGDAVFFLLSTFLFSKKKSGILYIHLRTTSWYCKPGRKAWFAVYSLFFWFYGQAVRPGLIAFQAVRPEMHTGPGRKSWTSLLNSGRKAWVQLKHHRP